MSAPDCSGREPAAAAAVSEIFRGAVCRVVVPLLANGASEAWFGYRDQRGAGPAAARRSASAAGKIQGFLDDITDQLQWTVQLPWRDGIDERHRFDVLRLMRQVPAVVEVMLVDGNGIERLHVSRVDPDDRQ